MAPARAMLRALAAFCAAAGLLAGLLLCAPAHADTAIALSQIFNGPVNFTGTQVTLRTASNSVNACSVASSTADRTAVLSLPTGAVVLSAQLYWSGSGPADYTVSFEKKTVNATRKYTSATVGNGMNYFGGAADVTEDVKAKGAGTYSFSGLTVSTGAPWCAAQAVLGGFSLLVVYSHPNELERVLNLYEGFRYLQNNEFALTANNFRWPTPWIPVREKARVGHITWEGDNSLQASGESFLFQNNELSDDMNPTGNQFNSKSNVNRDAASYGIDFDVYDTEVVQWILIQPSVTTTYRAGQDLVLLNAIVMVVPSMAVSDLSISMVRGGSLQVGQAASYALTVRNNGPYTEAGPITVTDTLPAGMSYVSASGTGWTCSASGQNVTCTYRQSLGPNLSAPALTINATVKQTGTLTNTATVSGTSDNNQSNNTASDVATGIVAPVASAGYAFTTRECAIGATLGSAACPIYEQTMYGGATTPATIYVTAINANKQAMSLSTSTDSTVPMQFSLSCQNPASGTVKAVYAGATLPACSANGTVPAAATTGAWSNSVNMSFAKGKASTALAQTGFSYGDVGTVQLNLLANKNVASSGSFTSVPTALAFASIANSDGVGNPGATTADGPGFARAGENVNALVVALLSDGKPAPNFGKETQVPEIAMELGKGPVPMASAGELTISSRSRNSEGGVALKLDYSDVGIITLRPTLENYLATGIDVNAAAATVVGRFFPAYYETAIAAPPLECEEAMQCAPDLSGAAYSGQPFDVQVSAFNAKGKPLANYQGAWRRPITLSAVSAEGQDQPSIPALQITQLGLDPQGVARMSGSTSGELAVKYSVDATTVPSAPAAMYIRATSSENLPGNAKASVTSRRPNPDDAEEAGIMLVNGRLSVSSAQGTNTRRTPLKVQAQYFDGVNWNNDTYTTGAAFAPASVFSACLRDLKTAGARDPAAAERNLANCNTNLVKDASGQTITLGSGAGVYWLAAPGAAYAGSVWVQVNGLDWLPSMRGRVVFGAARKPTIYAREVY